MTAQQVKPSLALLGVIFCFRTRPAVAGLRSDKK